jgi:site-specific DNA-methyltransferase (adenine-specific)
VLKTSGSIWLNLGDTYSTGSSDGAAAKSLLLAPERLALALQRDGWLLRNKIIWSKPNPMPSSVKDRLSCTYEVVYFLTKSPNYFFDLDAIRVPHVSRKSKKSAIGETNDSPTSPAWSVPESWRGPSVGNNDGLTILKASGLPGHPLGKNPGDVWNIATAGFRGAHHAVFPPKLAERPLLATCPEKVCSDCGVPWRRGPPSNDGKDTAIGALTKVCLCLSEATQAGVVLDPFIGSGTTAIVADANGRDWIGVEVNPEFAELANARIKRPEGG